MSRQNSMDVASLEVTVNGSQVSVDPIANGTKPFDDVKVMLVKGIDGTGAESLASAFSPSAQYWENQSFCTHDGKLYLCTTRHLAQPWNPADFTEVTVSGAFMAKGRDRVTAGRLAGSTAGNASTAEGQYNTASGTDSHAEGYRTKATKISSHSEGSYTEANHNDSHAEGNYTITGCNNQHVQGEYNVGKSTTAFEIGNGNADNARSNAFEVEWDGDVIAAGDITDGNGNVLSDKADSSIIASPFNTSTSYAVGDYATYEGKFYKCTIAHSAGAWNASHFTETTVDDELDTKMIKGVDYVTAGAASGTTVATRGTAEGNGNTVNASCGHAEGLSNSILSTGNNGHVEGSNNTVGNANGHAEGSNNTTNHQRGHAEGYHTQTGCNNQHVQGKYNVGKSTTAFEIGKGTNDNNRSNAFEVDWSGNVVASGDITDGDGNVLAEKVDYADISSEKIVSGNPITITDALPVPVKSLVANVEPIQDLHGYDYPWVGGAGKNKLWTELSNIKSINTDGTWNDNVYSINGIDYTISTNSSGNVTKIVANGTATANATLNVNSNFDTTNFNGYIYSCLTQAGGSGVFRSAIQQNGSPWAEMANDTGSGSTITTPSSGTKAGRVWIAISSGRTVSNLEFYPMVRPSGTDSTFAPYSNICPISGLTEVEVDVEGKNHFNKNASDLVTSKYLNYQTGGFVNNDNWDVSGLIKVRPNTQCVVSGLNNLGASNFEVCFYDNNETYISGITQNAMTFTTPSNTAYLRFDFRKADIDTAQLEIGSSATDYVPFVAGNTCTIDLNGTRYGGYITVDENGVTKFVGTHGEKDLGTLTYTYNSSDKNFYSGESFRDAKYYDVYGRAICEWYRLYNASGNYMVNGSFKIQGNRVYIKDLRYTDASVFKTALSGVKIVYELATPIEVTLSNTNITLLEGYNNVWCDSGDVELTYLANRCYESETKLEQSEVATVENGNTASRAYAVNEFMMWKGGLYKVTQAIASGATITSGTNVTKTTIGAVLTALLNG